MSAIVASESDHLDTKLKIKLFGFFQSFWGLFGIIPRLFGDYFARNKKILQFLKSSNGLHKKLKRISWHFIKMKWNALIARPGMILLSPGLAKTPLLVAPCTSAHNVQRSFTAGSRIMKPTRQDTPESTSSQGSDFSGALFVGHCCCVQTMIAQKVCFVSLPHIFRRVAKLMFEPLY